ncbi:hypothetical protein G6M26_10920 [Agrobacterium tumefaciens]|nr:hypothetical protein [Agrobacterium tumefaciens]NTE19033.1 hypothetical protein [Agrobacterium tumefaciens]
MPLEEYNEEQQVLDSIYLYANQIYFWNDQLPKYTDFNIKKYIGGSSIAKYSHEIFDLTGYALNPETGKSFEFNPDNVSEAKFSTIISKSNPGSQNNYSLTDLGYNYGITLVAFGNSAIYIEYVIKNSPAETNGIKRGMKVEEINGRKSENTEDFYKYIKTAFDSGKVELTLNGKPTAYKSEKYTIKRMAYIADPVNKVSVLKINNINIGYISYLKFSSPKGSDESLNNAFSYFNNEDVKELVIDLRYNGGGDIITCENFANLIAPQSANGKVMRKEKYNNIMQQGGATLLAKQPILNDDGSPAFIINGRTATLADGDYSITANTTLFKKTAGLNNLTRVYFIVSKKTASASELLVNCLKPYMDVKLIGIRTTEKTAEPVKTFGKPVGFFPVKIKSYSLYLSLFQNLNANNEGNYFNGMLTNISTDDDVETDFGNIEEKGLRSALDDMGYSSKIAAVKNRALESKLATDNNISKVKREIFGAGEFQELIKSQFKLRK